MPLLTLRNLADLSLADRAARIDAMAGARFRTDVASSRLVSSQDLAWAIAWNVGALVEGDERAGTTAWDAYWGEQTRLRSRGARATTLIAEVVRSIACEQRQDWRHPSSPVIDTTLAGEAFDALYAAERQAVHSSIVATFGVRVDDVESVVDDAWSRAFRSYWSAKANHRFGARSLISTLVSGIAANVAADMAREREGHDSIDDPDSALTSQLTMPNTLDNDHIRRIDLRATREMIDACLRRLPVRRRLIAHMVWLEERKAVDVARLIGVSEPAVSRHVRLAKESVGDCLRERASSPSLTSVPVSRLTGEQD